LVVSLIFVFDLCKFLCFFCFGFACFKVSWFLFFNVLCRCNLFEF
jgi:hypothetical protein